MTVKLPDLISCYHWSPITRRYSILREGLRRCTWRGTSLVLFATTLTDAPGFCRHVADRHDLLPTQLDLWHLVVPRDTVTPMGGGVFLIGRDVPADNLERLKSADQYRGL